MSIKHIANLNINSAYYWCIINGVNKSGTVNSLQNTNLKIKIFINAYRVGNAWEYWSWKTQVSPIISVYDANINRIVVSNKVPFGKKSFKYFIGYKVLKMFDRHK